MRGRPPEPPFARGYAHLRVEYDPDDAAVWYFMRPFPRPCFTPQLLHEIRDCHRNLAGWPAPGMEDARPAVRYMVGASDLPGVFNLGGDLTLFARLIESENENALRQYALSCVELVHLNANNLNLPLTTISLVQGNALGGGFEAAISCNVVIAERRATFGLPEVLFNLFPGMGAYNLLARRIGPARAERIILSGRTYSAQEMHDLGVVDVLAEDGRGVEATREYMRRHSRLRNAHESVHRVRQQLAPVTLESLREVVEIWIEAAFRIQERDLRLMKRLARAQERQAAEESVAAPIGDVIQLR